MREEPVLDVIAIGRSSVDLYGAQIGGRLEDMASGDCIFAATGVTDGSLLAGVKRRAGRMTTESVVMRASSGTVRWVRGEHRVD